MTQNRLPLSSLRPRRQLVPEKLIPAVLFFAVMVILWQSLPTVFSGVTETVFGPADTLPRITHTLILGSTDQETQGEVTLWQTFLIKEAKGSAATTLASVFESGSHQGYFGELTAEATAEWKSAHGLIPQTGTVDPQELLALVRK